MNGLEGRTAAVTGGSTLIGQAVVRELHRCGMAVAIADVDDPPGEALAGELGERVLYRHTDITRDDNGRGLLLRGQGDGTFAAIDGSISGIKIPGEQRYAIPADFNRDGRPDLVVTQNDNATKLYLNQSAARGLRIVLHGPRDNPCGIGAELRLKYRDGHLGPTRMAGIGSGPTTSTQLFTLSGTPTELVIRWNGAEEQVVNLPPDLSEIPIRYTPAKIR